MQPKSSRDRVPHDSSRPQFWDVRYANGETPWNFHGVPAALKAFLKTSHAGSVLIPGCGLAYEVRAFDEAGWKVTAIDFSPVAVKRARSELGPLANCVVRTDFFKHDFGSQRFDLIYERTFLCALPPDLWPVYVKRMRQLLHPGGKLAGIFLYGDHARTTALFINAGESKRVIRQNFSLIKTLPVTDSLPLFAGNEYWQEWVLNDSTNTPARRWKKSPNL